MTDSQQLFAEYRRTGADTAFRELVSRYIDLVYSTALRLVEGDTHRAEDVAQTVFVDLARKARALPEDLRLAGWLHRDACFVAANTMRGERRRQSRERQAVEMNALQNHAEADFPHVAPILDEAINELGEADRTAILLRFFEQHDFRTVGQALGSNEDAARMRVTRALEKLATLLKRRGVTASSVTLGVALGANAVQAAPVGLAVTISSVVAAATITTATVATQTAVTSMNWLNIKSIAAIVTAAIAAGTGTHLLQQREANRLQNENQALMAEQKQLAGERDKALSVATASNDELERLRKEKSELLRLRGEVGVLRRESNELDRLRKENARLLEQAKTSPSAARGTNAPLAVAKIVVTHIKQPQLISEEQIRTNISIKAGDIFDRTAVDRDVRNLQESGFFANIRVTDQVTDQGVIVNYFVQERPKVTGIHFIGNTRLDHVVLGQIVASKTGEPMDERILFNDAQKIKKACEFSGISGAKVKSSANVNEDNRLLNKAVF